MKLTTRPSIRTFGAALTALAAVSCMDASRSLASNWGGAVPEMLSTQIFVKENQESRDLFYFASPETTASVEKRPLVMVLHGGRGNMPAKEAAEAARLYLGVWAPYQDQVVSVAPATTFGWGWSGYALMSAAIDYAVKNLNADPERIFLWGQSMGGHASWRFAFWARDRFAGIIPVGGGYDYKDQLHSFEGFPIYHIHGTHDIFYNLKRDALENANWFYFKNEELPGLFDYTFSYQEGGHELFEREIPNILKWMKGKTRSSSASTTRIHRVGVVENFLGWTPSDERPADLPHVGSLDAIPTANSGWAQVTHVLSLDPAVMTKLLVEKKEVKPFLMGRRLSFEVSTENVAQLVIRLTPEEAGRKIRVRLKTRGGRTYRLEDRIVIQFTAPTAGK